MGGANNTTIQGYGNVTTVEGNWDIKGIADFNEDDSPDILWRDSTTGSNVVWFMGGTNDTTIQDYGNLTTVRGNWEPILIGWESSSGTGSSPNPLNDVRFEFTYFDYDQSTGTYGDHYTGYGYADEQDNISLGRRDRYDYAGNFTGYYDITDVTELNSDSGYQDIIEITSYYDAESGITSDNVRTYGKGLGGEYGDADSQAFRDYDNFNDFYNIEADFPTQSPDSDEGYRFTYFYTNGDRFSGWGVADIGDGLFVGRTDNVFADNGNRVGFRRIDWTFESDTDAGREGEEFIDSYIDATRGSIGNNSYSTWTSDGDAMTFDDFGYRTSSPFVPNQIYFDYYTPAGL